MRKSPAFTLIELLAVVAIISLLISIMMPAVHQAQTRAKQVAVSVQLYTITQGLMMFHTDFGEYPASLPQTSIGQNASTDRTDVDDRHVIQGAHRLAFALLGRDRLGCPAKSGESPSQARGLPAGADPSPDSVMGWYYSSDPDGQFADRDNDPDKPTRLAADDPNWGNPDLVTARKGPYINPETYLICDDKTVTADGYVPLLCDKYDLTGTTDIHATSDSYAGHSVIIYHRFNRSGNGIFRPSARRNIYYFEDNRRIAMLSQFNDVDGNGTLDANDFWAFIEDTPASIGSGPNRLRRPHNPDTFLLISRGYDCVFGTDDDVVNWHN